MFRRCQHIHFVGIGGIGMSGIADVLLTLGYQVSGSDMKQTAVTRRLMRRGARVHRGHHAKHLKDVHAVVVSSAINGHNPEVLAAKQSGIPVVPRAEMLAELMRLKSGIAVAGTHGKTSTTALIGHLLASAKLDPTLVIGGRVNSLRANAKLGKGEFLVAEADESDGTFVKLCPTIGVITNIDPEHMEHFGDLAHQHQAFIDFANKIPFYGAVVMCADHPVVQSLMPKIGKRCISYGLTADADFTARHIVQQEAAVSFEVLYRGERLGEATLPMVGDHYVQNALAAIAVARELEIPFSKIQKGLKTFRGVARRFEILSRRGPIVVDDYGHHPAEIRATLLAAKKGWPAKRTIAVVQPHRFSRLKALFDEFVAALMPADQIIIMDVYAAGEEPLAHYTGEKLWRSVSQVYPKKAISFAPTTSDVLKTLATMATREDLVIFLGAGDITKTARSYSKSSM